ncbi:MAG: NTP transferase domain-containing protein, partial [Atribacterota bacterium]
MSFSNWCFCVLAAGLGKRMYSSQPKVVLPVLGKPLINYLLDKGFQNHFGTVMTVVSPFTLQAIRGVVDPEVKLVVQENPLGTADAVKSIIPSLDAQVENVLVVYADMPLLEENTLTSLVTFFEMKKVPVALLTASSPFPGSFGRVIRDEGGNPVRIVEEKDCTPEEQVIHEINLGIYAFRKEFLSPILFSIGNANVQGEYYLTDVLEVATTQHIPGEVMTVEWGSQFINVNSPRDFAAVAGILRDRKNDSLLNLGVKLVDPQNIYVDWEATCEPDVWLYPGTMSEGKSEVGAGALIGPFTRLKNTRVGRGCRIEY